MSFSLFFMFRMTKQKKIREKKTYEIKNKTILNKDDTNCEIQAYK